MMDEIKEIAKQQEERHMWLLNSRCDYSTNRDYFLTFDEAKQAFQLNCKKVVGKKGLKKYLRVINYFCKKKYPKNQVPQAYEELKSFLTRYFTDPNYNPDVDTLSFDFFEDKYARFGKKDYYFTITIMDRVSCCYNLHGFIPLAVDEHEKYSQRLSFYGITPVLFSHYGKDFKASVEIECEEACDYDDDEDDYDDDEDGDEEEYADDYEDEDDDEEEYEDDEEEYTPPVRASSYTRNTPSKQKSNNELTYMEKVELRSAQRSYERAAADRARFTDPRTAKLYEATEKRAYAEYMRVLAKYAGKK